MSTLGQRAPKKGGRGRSTTKKAKTPKGSSSGVRFNVSFIRSPQEIVPDRARTVLTYVEQFALNPGIAVPDNYVFRANSLFDPNLTGAGHQPLGYDQYTTFYSNWVVRKASVKLTMTPPNLSIVTPQQDNAIVMVCPRRNDATAVAVISTAMEQPYVEWTMVAGYSRPPTLQLSVECAKFFGVSDSVYSSSLEYSGGIGANPTQVLHFVVTAASTFAGTNTPSQLFVTAEFEFEAEFYNAIVLAGS